MKCNYCGAENRQGACYCEKCGNNLSVYNDVQQDQGYQMEENNQQYPFENPKKKNDVLLLVTLGISVIALATIVIAIIVAAPKKSESVQENHTIEPVQTSSAAPATEISVPTVTPETIQPTQASGGGTIQQPRQEDVTVKYTMYVVNCDEWISLRSAPSTKSSRITTIPLGDSCGFIEASSNGFYKIAYNGKIGYALAQYLSVEKPNIVATVPSVQILYVVNCNEWITLRKSDSTSAAEITKIPLGSSVEYLGTANNGFYKIRYNGVVGYALSQYLK